MVTVYCCAERIETHIDEDLDADIDGEDYTPEIVACPECGTRYRVMLHLDILPAASGEGE